MHLVYTRQTQFISQNLTNLEFHVSRNPRNQYLSENSHVPIICDLHHWPVAVRSDLFLSSTGSRVLGPRRLPVSDYQRSKAELRTGMCSRQPLKSL